MKIIYKDGTVAECPQEEELHVLRHTAAHIMAQAIKRLYPQADFAFGPATENGFYYDVDLGDTKLTDEDLAAIEKEMKKICKENLPIKPFILPRDEAVCSRSTMSASFRPTTWSSASAAARPTLLFLWPTTASTQPSLPSCPLMPSVRPL